jgi:TolB-like protein
MKQAGIMLATALFMAVGMNCAGSSQKQPTTTGTQAAAPVRPPAPAPAAPATPTVTAAKTSTVDELDVAIRDASDCLNDNIPKESKIVILNIESNSANLSEYIIDELIANAINDKNFSVVDRRQLEAIQTEQKFQMSGAVDDKDALAIGKFFGAQTIVSGAMREMGGRYRMAIRARAVQTAVMQSQCNQTITASAAITDLVSSGGSSRPTGGAAITASGRTTQAATVPATTASPATPAAPPIQGTMVPGESLAEKLAWLTRTADSHNTYIVEVNADESIAPHRFEYKGAINITIVLRGDNENHTIRLQSNGTMFTVHENVTFILDNNITLQGHSHNNNTLIYVDGGTLIMNTGSTITGNSNLATNTYGHGVYIGGGTFTMNGGIISGNGINSGGSSDGGGGGVCISYFGYLHSLHSSTFTMKGGIISGNACENGGGVYVGKGTFNMSGGTISGNTAKKLGGGVYVESFQSTLTMKDGTITGNTAGEYGGGVYIKRFNSISFTKTRGIITGYSSDQNNGNVVRDEDGNILARKGHAVFVNEEVRKETTAGLGVSLLYGDKGYGLSGRVNVSGAWDQ